LIPTPPSQAILHDIVKVRLQFNTAKGDVASRDAALSPVWNADVVSRIRFEQQVGSFGYTITLVRQIKDKPIIVGAEVIDSKDKDVAYSEQMDPIPAPPIIQHRSFRLDPRDNKGGPDAAKYLNADNDGHHDGSWDTKNICVYARNTDGILREFGTTIVPDPQSPRDGQCLVAKGEITSIASGPFPGMCQSVSLRRTAGQSNCAVHVEAFANELVTTERGWQDLSE